MNKQVLLFIASTAIKSIATPKNLQTIYELYTGKKKKRKKKKNGVIRRTKKSNTYRKKRRL